MPSASVRVVLDTNVAVAGLLWRGIPYDLLGHAIAGRLQCFTSAPLIEELERVLGYDKLAARLASLNTTIAELVADYLELVELVIVADITPAVSADPDDDALLATALSGDAHLIVSGDAHLLNLKHYQGIAIVTAAECLRRLGAEPSK
ncbi:MAG TPA: putative toxin-antitoxin system toxin component, PIN family [Burkholderiales bacterium]|nr:putative toxin-antitoxin system toxin component, PIN family [Burkholderiales bacterium]